MYIKLENYLANSSFCLLFLSMIFYWLQAGLFVPVTCSSSETDFKLFSMARFGKITIILAQLCLLSLLILRWIESGHFPLSNLYESLMFLSWSFTFLYIFLDNFVVGKQNPFLGCIVSPCALFTNAFASFSLPLEMQQSSALVPALQSNWLMMHVTVMILSYTALILGSLLSIAFLILQKGTKPVAISISKTMSLENFVSISNNSTESLNSAMTTLTDDHNKNMGKEKISKIKPLKTFFSTSSENNLLKLAESLDNLSYRILGIGFPLLTIGILSGAVWANEAWGSYWSWDPKETWALLTWFVFAIYLHTRLNKGWQGEKPAIIASVGFITVWICFLGVNLIGEGLHSYGWFNT
nr:heme attachment to plastid cytochrome c [Microspora sp. UTEX LB472]